MHARRKCLPMWPRRCGTQRLLVTAKLSRVVSRSSDAGRKASSSGLGLTLCPLYINTHMSCMHSTSCRIKLERTRACSKQVVKCTALLLTTHIQRINRFHFKFHYFVIQSKQNSLRQRVPLAAILEFERFAGEIDLQIERKIQGFTLQ